LLEDRAFHGGSIGGMSVGGDPKKISQRFATKCQTRSVLMTRIISLKDLDDAMLAN
jgi:adenosylmethionine-8-amino-7-oxononanoate aminotransferase